MQEEKFNKQDGNLDQPNVMRCSRSHNFEEGVQVTAGDISDWHKKVLEDLLKDKDATYSHTRSGNGMVFGRRDKETGAIRIFEIRNGYKCYDYDNESENNA